MKARLLAVILNLSIAGIMSAQTTISEYIENKIIGKETPGFQYIIADSTGIIFEYNGGYANLKEQKPITAETEFKVYSATKTFTALAIMQLIQEGKISLDDKVGDLLDLPFSSVFTISQLLSHTAGVTGTPLITEIHAESDHADFDLKANTKRLLAKYQKLSYPAGKKMKYSNIGYLILGEIIEQVSGQSYTDYVEKNIFSVLGQTHPYGFSFNENTAKAYQKTSSLIHPLYGLIGDTKSYYDGKVNGFMGYKNLYLNGYSYGGAFSNARGLLHFGQTLIEEKSPLLSSPYKTLLFEEQFLSNGKSAKHTLAWLTKEKNGVCYYSHPGGGGGYSCEIRIYPDQGIVSVYMMNTTQLFSHLKLLNKLDAYFL